MIRRTLSSRTSAPIAAIFQSKSSVWLCCAAASVLSRACSSSPLSSSPQTEKNEKINESNKCAAASSSSLLPPIDHRWLSICNTLSSLGNCTSAYSITPYHDTGDAYLEMWKAVDNAHSSIIWHTYIAKDDKIGKTTIDKLVAAAQRGVRVEFLYDCGGNMTGRSKMVEPLVAVGATVVRYRPFFPGFGTYFFKGLHWRLSPAVRNHRKILVVDDKVGFTGGLNIGCEYAGTQAGGTGKFRDSHCKVTGDDAVRMLKEACQDTLQPMPVGPMQRALRWRQWAQKAWMLRLKERRGRIESEREMTSDPASASGFPASQSSPCSSSSPSFSSSLSGPLMRARAKNFYEQRRKMVMAKLDAFAQSRFPSSPPFPSSEGENNNSSIKKMKLRTRLRKHWKTLVEISKKKRQERLKNLTTGVTMKTAAAADPALTSTPPESKSSNLQNTGVGVGVGSASSSPSQQQQQQSRWATAARVSSLKVRWAILRERQREKKKAQQQQLSDAFNKFQNTVSKAAAHSKLLLALRKKIASPSSSPGSNNNGLRDQLQQPNSNQQDDSGDVSTTIMMQQTSIVQRLDARQVLHRIAVDARSCFAQVLLCNPLSENWSLQMALWLVVRRSAARVWVTTPYFIPHRKLLRATIEAARRGVDVRVLTGSRETTDPWHMWYAQQYLSHRLLISGVKLYEYHGGAVMHAKTVVVDGVWSSVGSYNWDILSNKLMEVSVTALDPTVAATMEQHFEMDLSKSEHVVEDTFLQRSFHVRVMCRFVYYALKVAELLSFAGYGDKDLTSRID